LVVAGQHDGPDAQGLKPGNAGACILTRLIAKRDQAGHTIFCKEDDYRLALRFKRENVVGHFRRDGPQFGRVPWRADGDETRAQPRLHGLPRDRGGAAENRRNGDAAIPGRRRNCAADWMA